MSVVKWSPMKELEEMRGEMENMFSEFLVPAAGRGRWWARPLEARVTAPAVQMYGDKDQMVLKAELPGVEREDIDLTIPLPVEVESDRARASLKGGVLAIVLPKKEEEKVKEIKVEVA